jgi:hypothetical protein
LERIILAAHPGIEPVIMEFFDRQRWIATHAADLLQHARWINQTFLDCQ